MTWGPVDEIDRTAKILIDAGKAKDPADARRYLQSLILQVAVGPEIASDPAAQAALATIVNAGRRAFKGGVHVRLAIDPLLTTGWTAGRLASATIERLGGMVVPELAANKPTLVVGMPGDDAGEPLLHLTWNGWSAGVVQRAEDRSATAGTAVSGVLAAGLGISETFQQALGGVFAGRRDVGLSLWRPDLVWRTPEAVGPALEYLPKALWLLGLGHLGQAYAWSVGLLPYAAPHECQVALMDFDTVVAGNTATQLLTTDRDVDRRKTRVVASAMESLGFRTRVVERAFDEEFRVVSHANPNRDEPQVALAGFDDVAPRRLLGGADLRYIVDAGLGSGPSEYLDMVLHTFPASTGPAEAFIQSARQERGLPSAYEAEIARQTEAGGDETAARCGMLEISGVSVGAAFVGVVASALVVADVVRVLHEGENYSVISLDLREPGRIRAVLNSNPGDHIPASTPAIAPVP